MTTDDVTNSEPDPIEMVAGLMIQGHATAHIIAQLEAYGLPGDEITIIVEQALAKLVKSAKMPATVRRGWCLEALRELYRAMMAAGDYSGALGALKEIAKLAALYSVDNSADTKNEIDNFIDEVMSLS